MIDTTKADAAAQVAEQALAAAQAAKDGAEIEYLSHVKNVKEINDGRTTFEANRLKARFISVMGYDAWVRLCANSR